MPLKELVDANLPQQTLALKRLTIADQLSMVALSAEASTAYADPLGLSEAWRPDGERRVVEPFTTALGRAHDRSDREGP